MNDHSSLLQRHPGLVLGVVAGLAAAATFGVFLLYQSIAGHQAEARQVGVKLVALDEKTVDPAVWGKNFPRQYAAYLRTADNYGTKYGGAGSEGAPLSKLKGDPHLPEIFAG